MSYRKVSVIAILIISLFLLLQGHDMGKAAAQCSGNCNICDNPCENNNEVIMTGTFSLNKTGNFSFTDDKENIYPSEINSSCKITREKAIEMKHVKVKGYFIKKEGNKKVFSVLSIEPYIK